MISTCETTTFIDLRTSRRVHVSSGIAFLRQPAWPELPSLPCSIENLSLGGCRCTALLERISPAAAQGWRDALREEPSALLDLLFVPHLSVRIPALVRYADSHALSPAIGVQFHNLSPKEHAMLTVALDRLEAPTHTVLSPDVAPQHYAGKRVTRILAVMGSLPDSAAQKVEQVALTSGKSVSHYLLRRGLVSSVDLTQALALHSELPAANLDGFELTEELLSLFPLATLIQNRMVPVDRIDSIVCMAVAKPLSRSTIRTLEARFNINLYVFLAPEEQLNALLRQIDPQPRQQPRDFSRRLARVPVEFTFFNGGDVVFNGQTLDICEGGFGLECSDDLSLCGVCIQFKLQTSEGVVEGLGSIRFVRKDDGQDRWIAGVEILELQQADWDRLSAYCASR